MATKKETDFSIIEEQEDLTNRVVYAPSPTRLMEVQLARQLAKMQAIADMSRELLHGMSEVESYISYKAATTAAAADFLTRAAAASQGGMTAALQAAQQNRFEKYLSLTEQISEASHIKMILSCNQAMQELDKRTVVDAIEELDANIADALLGRRTLRDGRR